MFIFADYRGRVIMQIVEMSHELNFAINTMENLLNSNDGDFVLETIRKYKQKKNLDSYTLMELRHRLNNI